MTIKCSPWPSLLVNANPDPDPYQGSIDLDSNDDVDQFLLNAEDMYSEEDTESVRSLSDQNTDEFVIGLRSYSNFSTW